MVAKSHKGICGKSGTSGGFTFQPRVTLIGSAMDPSAWLCMCWFLSEKKLEPSAGRNDQAISQTLSEA